MDASHIDHPNPTVCYTSTHRSRAKGACISILAGLVSAALTIGVGAAINRFRPEWMTKATELANSLQKAVSFNKEAVMGAAAAVTGVITTTIVGATAGRKTARIPVLPSEEAQEWEQSPEDWAAECISWAKTKHPDDVKAQKAAINEEAYPAVINSEYFAPFREALDQAVAQLT